MIQVEAVIDIRASVSWIDLSSVIVLRFDDTVRGADFCLDACALGWRCHARRKTNLNADPDAPDGSNTISCVDLLVDHGADHERGDRQQAEAHEPLLLG